MQSKEVYVDDVRYLIESECSYYEWNKVVRRVEKYLINLGKEVAQSVVSKATTVGYTKINHNLIKFKLTIHPEGNSFNAT